MVFIAKKLIDQNCPVVIAEDITNDGAKRFLGFTSHLQIFPYIAEQEQKCFHELMSGLENRKLYFDADRKAGEGEFPDFDQFARDISTFLIGTVLELFGVELNQSDICITDSCVEDKFSSHIIVRSFNTSVVNMRLLYQCVSMVLSKYNSIYTNILDKNVYKPNQTLRLLHCNKMGKNNTKKLYTTCFSALDTLVSYLDDSEEIFLKPEIQKQIDARDARRQEASSVCQVAKSPEMFRQIVMGLAQDRADDFGDWSKVCLALGHEGSGVEVALAFSRRSDKFNEVATKKLYNRGTGYSGRPLTVGTLLAMLKKDNPVEFGKVLAASTPDEVSVVSDDIKLMIEAAESEPSPPKPAKQPKPAKPAKQPKPAKPKPPSRESQISDACLNNHEPDYAEIAEQETETVFEGLDPDYNEPDFDIPDFDSITAALHESQEDKIARLLDNPSFYLNQDVSVGVSALQPEDTLIRYSKRFMEDYPSNYNTTIVKAQKGQGKTVALEKYITEHNPKRVVVISFRRSFSNELTKRLEKLGFINYRDIEGPITADRVIIQVESLHRLRWAEICDLMVLDEIESIRSQFFSPTCKLRTAVIEKYEMLLRTSKQVFAMDADISENTVAHLATREGTVCYIENTHQEIQSEFKEYYTTKIEKIMPKICAALDAGQKIVIPTNRSIEFMAGLRQEIEAKYPSAKVQMYNSKTIREASVAAELKDVTKAWKLYDVVMYSPTVSAGVSFDEIHFDKCFCIFTNNGKINSMRQMINRVRKFVSNEYYYCLQSFGGSSKPMNIDVFERHICSNRFVHKPEFIMSREHWDGTREYPYKTMGYYLWMYNETEKARDKNMFILNFLRQQYNSGIGVMSWLADEETKTENIITKADIKVAQVAIAAVETAAIAGAGAIDEPTMIDIRKRMEEEKPVSEDERYSLLRRNLLDCYELSERVMLPEFVKEFNDSAMKIAFHNRKALARGLDVLVREDAMNFNGLFMDETTVEDDLSRNYKSMKMVIAKELVVIAGFTGFYDESEVSKEVMLAGFKAKELKLIERMPAMCDVLGRAKRRRPDIAKWDEAMYLRSMLAFVNSIITELFQLKIKETGRRTGIYIIEGKNIFDFSVVS